MSIIGIILFSLSLLIIVANYTTDYAGALSWGIIGLLYAIPYSIVGLVKSNKKHKVKISVTQELISLSELKEKGILTEDEFQAKKMDLLNQ